MRLIIITMTGQSLPVLQTETAKENVPMTAALYQLVQKVMPRLDMKAQYSHLRKLAQRQETTLYQAIVSALLNAIML